MGAPWTEAQRRVKRQEYARNHQHPHGMRVSPMRTDIPDDIERREFHEPCWRCNARGACRHRSEASSGFERSLTGNAAAMMVAL